MDVAVLAVHGAFDSGLTSVLDVLDTANALREQIDRPPQPWQVTTLGIRRQVRTRAGHIVRTKLRRDLTRQPELLIVPALGVKEPTALVEELTAEHCRPVLRLITEAKASGVALAGACTGTFFLAEAGVLDGMEATTSWWLGPAFRQRYPAVRLDDSLALVQTDRVTTAGAAFAHIDLALSVVQRQSPALADLVARYLLIGDRQSQATFALPTLLAKHDPVMSEFERWVRDHLDTPIQIATAAHAVGLSERTLQRTTASTVGMSPIDFVNEVRIDHATFLLRTTNLTVDAVATKVGYQNASTLRSLVRRRRSMTIGQIRHGGAATSQPPGEPT
ncbi:MAG: GlxA family transcriptional regulator [Sciscionella sp.]